MAYENAKHKAAYWQSLCGIVSSAANRPIVFIGDFNADPSSKRSVGGRFLSQLAGGGWQIPSPTGRWSYISRRGSTYRIDHAIVSPSVRITGAQYVAELADVVLAGSSKSAVSDHAALVLEIEPASTHSISS